MLQLNHVFKHLQVVCRMVLIERFQFLKHIRLLTDFLDIVYRGVVCRHFELLREITILIVFVQAVVVVILTLLVPQHRHELLHNLIRSVGHMLSDTILDVRFFCALTFAIAVHLTWLLLFVWQLLSLMVRRTSSSLGVNTVQALLSEDGILFALRCQYLDISSFHSYAYICKNFLLPINFVISPQMRFIYYLLFIWLM